MHALAQPTTTGAPHPRQLGVDVLPGVPLPDWCVPLDAPAAATAAPEHRVDVRPTTRRRGAPRRNGHRPDWQRTVVLIPAHNEEEQIAAAIESVLAQTYRPALVVVVADNCTDRTIEIARQYPVVVMETVGNTARKAGALNQAWQRYGQDARFVVTMDADTILDPHCLERMRDQMRAEHRIGGICGRPLSKVPPAGMSTWNTLLWHLLALDFAAYDQTLVRRKYTTEVLGGFGSLFRNSALRDVARAHGTPWATDSIVEDYRLSLHLREADWQIRVAPQARAYTDTPVTLRALWQQRLRWSGGTFQEMVRAGWKPWTRRNWIAYGGVFFGVLLRAAGIFAWALILLLDLPIQLNWFWAVPIALAAIDRLVVAARMRHSTWLDYLLAVLVFPMELLTLVGQAWAVRSAWLVLRNKPLHW
ncbi:MAG TPA: glycosyltransferase family 2 protein [Mycobacteriales bacterium]|nr:glycosyltransferase family 2 protein [Mycobacteriales bacterium]